MKWQYPLIAFLFVVQSLAGCATTDIEVLVVDTDNLARPGVPVALIAIDDAGNVLNTVQTEFTDDRGFAVFAREATFGSASLFRAFLPTGNLDGFAAGEFTDPKPTTKLAFAEKIIDPIASAVITAVLYITETAGGRSLDDFSITELSQLTGFARVALEEESSLNLKDKNALVQLIINAIGRKIADAAGGTITVTPLVTILAANAVTGGPTFATSPPNCLRKNAAITGQFVAFDFTEDAALCNVKATTGPIGDAFDIGMQLSLIGDTIGGSAAFPGDPSSMAPLATVTYEDARELVYGPVTSDGGLNIARKALVLPSQDVVRYLEIFTNPTGNDKTISIRISGTLGLDSPRVFFAQNHADLFDQTSDYGAFFDVGPNNTSPTVAFIIDGPGAVDSLDSASFPPNTPY